MNIIKQSITKRFVKKYCFKIDPNITFIEKCGVVWSLGIIGCTIGGGIYGSYIGYNKNNEFNEDVFVECIAGVMCGSVVGTFGPFLTIKYLIKKISDEIE